MSAEAEVSSEYFREWEGEREEEKEKKGNNFIEIFFLITLLKWTSFKSSPFIFP